jgi:tripartite-type tricarboxylate transporter receptor subunit TctC
MRDVVRRGRVFAGRTAIGLALCLAGSNGIVAPPKTPKDIVDTINADVNEALRQPELQDHLRKLSAEIFGGSVEKTSRYMGEEVDRWRAVIKAANIEMQ